GGMPSSMVDSFGNPVDMTGPTSTAGKIAAGITGIPFGTTFTVTDPDTGISSTLPQPSPNMDGTGFGSTFNGSDVNGIFGDITGMGSVGRSGSLPTGAGTGRPSPDSTNFGVRPDPDANTTQVPDAPVGPPAGPPSGPPSGFPGETMGEPSSSPPGGDSGPPGDA